MGGIRLLLSFQSQIFSALIRGSQGSLCLPTSTFAMQTCLPHLLILWGLGFLPASVPVWFLLATASLLLCWSEVCRAGEGGAGERRAFALLACLCPTRRPSLSRIEGFILEAAGTTMTESEGGGRPQAWKAMAQGLLWSCAYGEACGSCLDCLLNWRFGGGQG